MDVRTVTNGPFAQNCYLVSWPATAQALLIDPGIGFGRIERAVAELSLKPLAILCTHAHIDHVAGVGPLKERYRIPFYLHPGERGWLRAAPAQALAMGLGWSGVPRPDHWIEPDRPLAIGPFEVEVRPTPGHTRGGVSFRMGRALFTGDTLFAGSVGRTDLPGGSAPRLLESIEREILPLDDETLVFSGHGPVTTVGAERAGNPFILQWQGRKRASG